jgi:hypothetical protein
MIRIFAQQDKVAAEREFFIYKPEIVTIYKRRYNCIKTKKPPEREQLNKQLFKKIISLKEILSLCLYEQWLL